MIYMGVESAYFFFPGAQPAKGRRVRFKCLQQELNSSLEATFRCTVIAVRVRGLVGCGFCGVASSDRSYRVSG